MKAARIVVLGVALAAGGAAAFLVSSGDDKKPAPAPAPVAQLPTVDVLIAKSDIGMGTAVSARISSGRPGRPRPPAAATSPRRTGRTPSTSSPASITRAPVHRRRADPRGQADQGQRRLRLHGGDPAVGHARGFDRNLAGNRRRRLHPAQRPGRRDPVAPRQRPTARRSRTRDQRDDPDQRARAGDRPDRRGKERPARRGRQDRDARAHPRQAETLAQSRQLGTLSLALRSLLDASKTSEVDDRDRRGEINTVRFGVSTNR